MLAECDEEVMHGAVVALAAAGVEDGPDERLDDGLILVVGRDALEPIEETLQHVQTGMMVMIGFGGR